MAFFFVQPVIHNIFHKSHMNDSLLYQQQCLAIDLKQFQSIDIYINNIVSHH